MQAKDILFYGHRDALQAFQDLQVEDWNRVGVTTRWTPKDVLAHLLSYELLLEDAFKFVLGQGPTPTLDAMNAAKATFNDTQVAKWHEHAPAEILLEYTQTHARVVALAEKLGPDRLREVGTIPWYGSEYALDDFIVYANYAHIREHLAQLSGFLKRLHPA